MEAHPSAPADCCGRDSLASGEDPDARRPREMVTAAVAAVLFGIGLAVSPSPGAPAVFLPAYLLSGWGVLSTAGRNLLRGRLFDETFLMTVATLGALAIGQLPEAVAVMLFFRVGELVQGAAVGRSRRSIRALLEVRPESATLMGDGALRQVPPATVAVGAEVLVRPGERVPLDGEVLQGASLLDTSALTGESMPRPVTVGDTALAGMVNRSGALVLRVSRPFAASSVSRILQLVEESGSRRAPTERFITRLARIYTPIVVGLALLVALLPPLLLVDAAPGDWAYRAMVLLVISCPCGLVISIPLGYFGGVGGAARQGILVKGSVFLDVLSRIGSVVFDKTGTLTQGRFQVMRVEPGPGFSEAALLALAAQAESRSTHPVADAILRAHGREVAQAAVAWVRETPGQGLRARVGGRLVLAGNDRLLRSAGISFDPTDGEDTVVHLAVDGAYAGRILIADALKPDAAQAVRQLRARGVAVSMLTGDSAAVAGRIARRLGLDRFRAELLPEEKVAALESCLGRTHAAGATVAYVGDGINDAPVLARADVGIAMGGLGSDAAIETADVVIMSDAPTAVDQAIAIGRRTRRIVLQNIVMALLVKGVFVALGAVGVATLWEAVFADVGVALLAILNASRVLLAPGRSPARPCLP